MVGVLAVTLTGLLGATAAKDLAPGSGAEQSENEFWIKTKLADDLLAGRLNVTNVAKSPAGIPVPVRSPRKRARTAQLTR
ncbi:hypothetical protein [Methyloceanibacter methanicus]|nr:hypothetical protein [Methyloceanibacter methanicus]